MARVTYAEAVTYRPQMLLASLASGRNPDGSVFSMSTSPPDFNLVLTSGVLLAAGGSVESGWIDAEALGGSLIHALRTATAGTYALEIDWSRDGAAVDVVEILTPTNNASLTKDVVSRFFRVRVRNTDGVAAFTAHRTTVYLR